MIDNNIVGRGRNIKCYDKIKLKHVSTGLTLHTNGLNYKSGSRNQSVSCHRSKDDSDWFVVIKPNDPQITHHFKYNSQISLINSHYKKYIQLSGDFDSNYFKQKQVSLSQTKNQRGAFPQQEWVIQKVEASEDEYWRIGQIVRIRLKKSKTFLCSSLRQNEQDESQVYGRLINNPQIKNNVNQQKSELLDYLWMVSQTQPFIFTPVINQKKKIKQSQQAQELNKLNKARHSLPKKNIANQSNQIQQILKLEGRRKQQMEIQRLKMLQNSKSQSCWRRYICCCCKQNQYKKLN